MTDGRARREIRRALPLVVRPPGRESRHRRGREEDQWLTCWPCHLAEVPRCNGASCVLRCVSGPLDLRLSCTRALASADPSAHAHVGTRSIMGGIIDLGQEL